MSIETWKEEFYPKPAEEATGSELEAARHSLRKWEGARPEALARHGLEAKGLRLEETGLEMAFHFGADDCALCQFNDNRSDDCHACILYRLRGCACYEVAHEGDGSPYTDMRETSNPGRMIALLEQAVAALEAEEAGKL